MHLAAGLAQSAIGRFQPVLQVRQRCVELLPRLPTEERSSLYATVEELFRLSPSWRTGGATRSATSGNRMGEHRRISVLHPSGNRGGSRPAAIPAGILNAALDTVEEIREAGLLEFWKARTLCPSTARFTSARGPFFRSFRVMSASKPIASQTCKYLHRGIEFFNEAIRR